MADVRETTAEQYPQASPEDEDMRGADGKKKKFKPLSAVRKLFGGKKRKKEESVVAVKAQSTTALHSSRYGDEDDDDDDDGGFKSHQQKPVGLVHGTRSLSEDSVFSPETREAPIGSFPKSAVSEESLPKSAFQSELFSKLNKRRSQYSDDDRDDGLPRSPVPPVTTADVIMGAPLKPPGKKSSNRDSDQSLISVDSSENEEDKLFEANWKNSVPSIRSSKDDKSGSSPDMDSLDFSSIQKTELLTSGAAKDRISIKPKARRATSKTRKKRDTNSPLSLPSLNEESPTGTTETSNVASPSGTKYTKATPGDISPTAGTVTVPDGKNPVKNASGPFSTGKNSETSKSASTVTAVSNTRGTAKELKSTDVNKKGVSLSVAEDTTNSTVSEKSGKQSSGKVSPTSKVAEVQSETESKSNTSRLTNKFLQGDMGDDTNEAAKPASSAAGETFGGASLKSRMSQFQNSSNTAQEEKPSVGRGPGLKASDPSAQFSPRGEDFRFKRQNRSKTLPGAVDNSESGQSSAQNSPGLQRAKSHRVTGTGGAQADPTSSASSKSGSSVDSEERRPSLSSTTSSVNPSSTVNKLGNRFSAYEKNNSSSEPAWMNMVKKKKDDSEDKASSSSGVALKSGATGSAPKSVFSSSSYLDKKRGSVDSSSSGGNSSSRTNTPRDSSKISEASSTSSSASGNVSQGKRESIEINVTELSSSKSVDNKTSMSVSSPSSSTAPSSVFTSSGSQSVGAASTADRARLFSGTQQTSSASSTKQDSTSASDPAARPVGAGGGINQFRGGSVKTSPTKSTASSDTLKPWQPGRSSSVKVSPAFLASSSPSSTTANISKPSGVAVSGKTVSASSSSSSKSPTSSQPSSSSSVPSTTSSSLTSSSSSSSGRFTQSMSNNNNKNTTSNNTTSLPSSHSVMVTSTSTTASTIPTSASSPTRSSSVKSAQTSVLTSKPPLAASAFGVKSSSVKSVSFSGVKPDNSPSPSSPSVQSNTTTTSSSSSSSSPRSNSGASVISVNSSSSSSSSSTTPLSSSQSNLNKASFGASGRTNPIRAHASFTHPSSVKPAVSPSSTPSINKSPSLRAANTSSSVTNKSTAPALKRAGIDEQKKEEVKPATAVPAWRANLAAKKDKEVKIEIIETGSKNQSSAPAQQQNKTEVVMRKASEKSAFSEAAKKSESASSQAAAEKLNNRSSRVLDMVKNFQNLQVTT